MTPKRDMEKKDKFAVALPWLAGEKPLALPASPSVALGGPRQPSLAPAPSVTQHPAFPLQGNQPVLSGVKEAYLGNPVWTLWV